jgi:hypothetical protein
MFWELHFGQFDALFGHFRGGVNKNHTMPSSLQPVCKPKFEPVTSKIGNQNAGGYFRFLLQLLLRRKNTKGVEMKHVT